MDELFLKFFFFVSTFTLRKNVTKIRNIQSAPRNGNFSLFWAFLIKAFSYALKLFLIAFKQGLRQGNGKLQMRETYSLFKISAPH